MADLKHDIEKYITGKLTPAERNALERRALDDPFLREALEGAEQISPEDFSADLHQLQGDLQDKTNKKGKVIPLWVWTARIAAGVALIAVSTFVVVKLFQPEPSANLAKREDTVPATSQQSAPTISDSSVTSGNALADSDRNQPAATSPKPTVPASQNQPSRNEELLALQDTHEENPPVTLPVQEPSLPQKEIVAEESVSYSYTDTSNAAEPKTNQDAITNTDGYVSYSNKKKNFGLPEYERQDDVLGGRLPGVLVESKTDDKINKEGKQLVTGRVTDDQGDGIPGVNILIRGTDIGTVTDASGNYQIHVDSTKSDLVFSFIGMQTIEESVPQESVLDVSLEQDVSQLSEVVVVGYSAQKTEEEEEIPTLELAVPAGGRTAYKQYLEKNLRYPEQALENKVEGRVTVQFTVDPSGKISDFNVLKGIGFGCDEEVIRLIKQGPKWTPTKRDTEPMKDKVKVRMRFRLPKK